MGHTCYYYIKDRDYVIIMVHHFVLTIESLIAVTYSYIKRDNVHFLITNAKKSFNYNSPSMVSYMKKIVKDKVPIAKKVHYSIVIFPFYVLINDMLYSSMEKYFWGGEYLLLYPIYTALDLENWFFYCPILVWEMSVIFFVIVVISGIIGLILLVYIHLMIEFSMLEHAIMNMNKIIEEKIEMYSTPKMSEDVKKNIIKKIQKECMDEIARHMDDIIIYFNNAKGYLNFIYSNIVVAGIMITVCTGVICLSENQAVRMKFFGIFVVQNIYLYAVCWIGESIANKSENLRIVLYDIEWWNFPKSCHMSIRLMLVRLMNPFYFYTFLGQKIQLETFMDMVKGSYSYFNMIIQSQ
ncbi:uncharacterized protein LOC106670594 isoform X1 [Cimex lectularius]|uniref:Odorant receptor n=1 Tax=Cimex lectularius TaxID=79782 RepID=A0A8I6S655_CIMLE|nr:uncharacterized protein LOC106670594 isoform X1 [Cimex lectularius]